MINKSCILMIFLIGIFYLGNSIFINELKAEENPTVISPLQEEDFLLKGVKPIQQFSQTLKESLDKKVKISDVYPEGVHERLYQYSDFSVTTVVEELGNEKIAGLTIYKKSLKTYRGITLGDNLKSVFDKYGPIDPENDEKSIYSYELKKEFNGQTHVYYLTFFVNKKNNIDFINIGGYID